jgi:hypothetical protein
MQLGAAVGVTAVEADVALDGRTFTALAGARRRGEHVVWTSIADHRRDDAGLGGEPAEALLKAHLRRTQVEIAGAKEREAGRRQRRQSRGASSVVLADPIACRRARAGRRRRADVATHHRAGDEAERAAEVETRAAAFQPPPDGADVKRDGTAASSWSSTREVRPAGWGSRSVGVARVRTVLERTPDSVTGNRDADVAFLVELLDLRLCISRARPAAAGGQRSGAPPGRAPAAPPKVSERRAQLAIVAQRVGLTAGCGVAVARATAGPSTTF